jgi:hypothetical protein
MTDFTWDISFQLTGTYLNSSLQQTFNVPATVSGTIVTNIDSGFLNVESDFVSWSFTYSAPSVGFAGSASGGPTIISLFGNVLSASGDTLSYVFDPNTVFANHIFFHDSSDFFEQVDFGISLAGADFVQGDIELGDGLAKSDLFDATVTQPFQIGTEVVATLADVSEIGSGDFTLDLSAIFNVAGNVTISDNDKLVSIDLSHLLSVGGNFTLTNNGALLTLDLPSLETVTGSVNVSDDASLGVVSLGNLTTVTGSVDVSNDPSLTSLGMGGLTTAGSVNVTDDASLGIVSLGSLTTVTGSVDVSNDASLTSLGMDGLTTTGSVNVTDDASLGVVSLGSLTTITGSVDVSNDPSLTSLGLDGLTTTGSVNVTDDASLGVVSLGSLTTVAGSVDVSGDTSAITINLGALISAGAIVISDNGVITLDLSALVTAGGDVSITDNTHLLTVDLPSLTSVDGSVTITGDTSATSADLGSLSTIGGDVTLAGDTSLTNVDLGSLNSTGGNVDITGDTSAANVNLGSMTSAGGDVAISGDSSATTVNLGSLDTTGGNVTIDSGADATLDASALGPGGGTVKLIGDNLTTTIDLGSLDHMQGTLTISSADGVTLTSHAGLGELDISGTAHDDTLIGSATSANVIDAGAGNDTMSGGAADDSFVFDFSVSQHTEFHHDFVSLANLTSVAIGSAIYFKPAPTASITAWQVWDNALTTYANNQADNTGGDHFTAFTNSNPVAKNDGTIKLIDGYFHDYNAPVTDLAGSGFDTITNFANQALSGTNSGGGNDGLLFNGLSGDQTALNYWGNWLSSTTANGNTTIDFHDVAHHGADIASITLTGVTTDVATLVHDGIIKFGTSPVSDWHV